jgi:hypothetical protein
LLQMQDQSLRKHSKSQHSSEMEQIKKVREDVRKALEDAVAEVGEQGIGMMNDL